MSGAGKKIVDVAKKVAASKGIDWDGMSKLMVSDEARREFANLRRAFDEVNHELQTKFSQMVCRNIGTLFGFLSFNFWTIAICRMLVGVGEASFISLAPPCIVDVAPVAKKTAWLGIFFMCIPAGVAFGYVLDGLPEMIGHYLAEFSISYKPVKHGRPGIGATHISRFIPLK